MSAAAAPGHPSKAKYGAVAAPGPSSPRRWRSLVGSVAALCIGAAISTTGGNWDPAELTIQETLLNDAMTAGCLDKALIVDFMAELGKALAGWTAVADPAGGTITFLDRGDFEELHGSAAYEWIEVNKRVVAGYDALLAPYLEMAPAPPSVEGAGATTMAPAPAGTVTCTLTMSTAISCAEFQAIQGGALASCSDPFVLAPDLIKECLMDSRVIKADASASCFVCISTCVGAARRVDQACEAQGEPG
ncbi:hypothetical protein M885DRAFT_571546 [Pelagophyceae sp. CCMP2097]|nr:hypothetical protein M885DRAFT_571546 [Pelagophyceae sp. CCMP2097]